MANLNSLPTVRDPGNYPQQANYNETKVVQMFSAIFPDSEPGLLQEALTIVSYLAETNVNPQIIPRVIRGIHNVMIGTGKGQVIVHVQGSTTNVSVRETDEEIKTRL